MKTALRIDTIGIDLIVPDGLQWITATMQKLEVDIDNKITNITPREDRLYRRMDKVALEMVSFVDPVTQETVTISTAGIGMAIKVAMLKWMLEDNPDAVFEPDTGLVVLNG